MSYRNSKIITLITIVLVMLLGSFTESNAQFGKNKVQYDVFDWKYIESKHFDVYYDDGIKYLAKFTALSAEKALVSIQETLNFNLDKRVVIVIYASHNEFQQTNVVMSFMPEGVGGVTELYKNRVVIPFQGDYSQLRHVIHHELVHAVLNEMFYGGTLQTSISTGNMVQIPIWMNEGLAEWESIGGMNTETDMFMRDLTISENLPPLTRFGGYLAYRGGQTFYWYIAQKYGPQRVGELVNRLKISRTVESAFQATFNEKIKEFAEEFEKYLKKYYWTDLDVFVDPEEFSVPLTDHEEEGNFYNTSPAISPDGEKMAFISDENGIFKIFVQKLQDKDSKREIVSSFRQQDFEDLNLMTPGISWSPDGKMLAISAKAGPEDAVFLVDVETEDYDKLTFGLKSITSVVWSPDGDKLAFIGTTKGIQSDIFIYNLEKEQLKNVTNDIFSDQYPIWSPDSKEIFFISDRGEYTDEQYTGDNFDMWSYDFEKSDIYSISAESGSVGRITFDPEFKKTSIAVSPAGDELLYVSDKNGIGNIYSIDLQTGSTHPKTNSLNGISQLSLSKDGSKLLFSVLIDGGYDIHMMRYPLEKTMDIDELPLTKFRKQFMEQKQYMSDLAQEFANIDEEKDDEQFSGYGDFQIEFNEQELINPNIDAAEKDSEVARDAIKGQDQRDTLFPEHDYKIKFSPDLVLGNPSYNTFFGFQGVTQMLFSDVLGDHQIYLQANLLIDLRNSSFYAAYLYQPEIIDYQISAHQRAGFVPILQQDTDTYDIYRFRSWGAGVNAFYPFDLFNRVEWGLQWMNISQDNLQNRDVPSISRMLFVPEGRYVHDDVLYGQLSPQRGARYYIGFKGTPKMSSDGIGFMTMKFDYRRYVPIFDFLNLAVRGTAGASLGPDPQDFILGGIDNWINRKFKDDEYPFQKPEDFAFMEFITPMRGFTINEARGSKYFLTNVELRFPLVTALIAGPIPLLLQGMEGVFFYDLGAAWSGEFRSTYQDQQGQTRPQDLLMSTGFGLRSYILGLPIRMDVGWQNLYHNWSTPVWMFSLGFSW